MWIFPLAGAIFGGMAGWGIGGFIDALIPFVDIPVILTTIAGVGIGGFVGLSFLKF